MEIDNKNTIVSGASSGLGVALANTLVKKGAMVYELPRKVEKLNAIQNELGTTFVPVAMEITNPQATISWVNNTFFDSSVPDILINIARAGYFSKIDQLLLERWYAMINTNLTT